MKLLNKLLEKLYKNKHIRIFFENSQRLEVILALFILLFLLRRVFHFDFKTMFFAQITIYIICTYCLAGNHFLKTMFSKKFLLSFVKLCASIESLSNKSLIFLSGSFALFTTLITLAPFFDFIATLYFTILSIIFLYLRLRKKFLTIEELKGGKPAVTCYVYVSELELENAIVKSLGVESNKLLNEKNKNKNKNFYLLTNNSISSQKRAYSPTPLLPIEEFSVDINPPAQVTKTSTTISPKPKKTVPPYIKESARTFLGVIVAAIPIIAPLMYFQIELKVERDRQVCSEVARIQSNLEKYRALKAENGTFTKIKEQELKAIQQQLKELKHEVNHRPVSEYITSSFKNFGKKSERLEKINDHVEEMVSKASNEKSEMIKASKEVNNFGNWFWSTSKTLSEQKKPSGSPSGDEEL
jgi:hypothetical protein